MSLRVLQGALDIDVRRLIPFKTPNIGRIVLMSTYVRYRPSQMRRMLTTATYNAADVRGLQILGEDGLKIYTRSKRDQNVEGDQFDTLMCCVKKACLDEGISFRLTINDWTVCKKQPQPASSTSPDADDRLAINAALADLEALESRSPP